MMPAKHLKKWIVLPLVAVLTLQYQVQSRAEAYTDESYGRYQQQYASLPAPDESILITTQELDKAGSKGVQAVSDYHGSKSAAITDEHSTAKYTFEAAQAGLYEIAVRYCAVEGKGIPVQRKILVNGEVPFSDFNSVQFDLIWRDEEIQKDKSGNEYVPEQVQKFEFQEVTLHSGESADDNYRIYLKKGTNSISFVSLKEGMAIESIRLFRQSEIPSYQQYAASLQAAGKTNKTVKEVTVQAEKPFEKSDSSLVPLSDRSSPMTEPNDSTKIRLNTIGGQNWKNLKQTVSWEINAEQEGLYQLRLRFKQDYYEGTSTYRRLYLDGTVPFQEMQQIEFGYQKGWQAMTLGGDEPYLFYLTKGRHVLTLENVYGKTAEIYETISSTIVELNTLYRNIIMITSLSPDTKRDYHLERLVPNLPETLKSGAKVMKEAKNELYRLTGSKGRSYSLLETLQVQLEGFVQDPYSIPARLATFSTNISDLSTWVLTSANQPLLLDYLQFSPAGAEDMRADAGFFQKFLYDVKALVLSFFYDYSSFSADEGSSKEITLWLGGTTAGRDQANAIKALIDNHFTKKYHIAVKIRLVDMNALLPAVAAGGGPDAAISQDKTMPLNYGFRGAVYDLSNFSDCKQVLDSFPKAASVPFCYADSVYALPDSFVFPMMFYRKDILEELKIEVPQTWDDVYTLLPKLNNKYLNFGVPSVTTVNNDLYYTFLYQNNGSLYDKTLRSAAMDSEESVAAFESWANLYTKYGVAQTLDSFTRFRTGQAPIVIAPYTFYNQLVAAASEIQGMWEMTLVPGTKTESGEINRSVCSAGTATVIFTHAKDKDSAWEFVKWWTSGEAQQKYNQQLEILLGPSGRLAIASVDALSSLPWSVSDIEKLQSELQYTKGVPEVPGGYMTPRYLNTAIILTINDGISPREAITGYNKLINDEIRAKRQEFGLK